MDNYYEIKLPEKWYNGDILINLKTKDFAVYRKDDAFRKETFRDAVYVKNNGIIFSNYPHRNEDFSLALDDETQQFYELLHKQGKDWDVKNKKLIDWKRKPKCGENYFYVTSLGEVKESMLDKDGVKAVLDFGNYFFTEEEAKTMAEKIKHLLTEK